MGGSVRRVSFPAMSTTVEIAGVGVSDKVIEAAVARGRRLAETWEATFSRFRPDSELSRLNAAGGSPVPVSARFLTVLRAAIEAAERTGRRFDPTIVGALEAAGYDRDLSAVRARTGEGRASPVASVPGPAGIEVDQGRGTVRLPPGVRIDLGGIAKGAFGDRLAEELSGWPGGAVDAGGDVRLWGRPPGGDCWIVGIEDPSRPDADRLVAAVRGPKAAGIATSGVHRRRWVDAGVSRHHLIDPATGCPLGGDVLAVTAFAPSAVAAEVAAKALIVAGARGEPPALHGATTAVMLLASGRAEIIAGSNEDACRFFAVEPLRRPA